MSTKISTDYHHIPSETHDLYSVYIGNHKINTIVTACPLEIIEWLSQFESSTNLLIGLDIEWRPNIFRNQDNPAATLQLCVAHACLIVQLLYCPTLPQQLFDFFAKKEFTFFGVGIDHDADKLFDDYGLLVGGKVVDLATLASQKYADKSLNNAGLKELARIVLGMEIQKPKSISCSNWDQDWLNPGQVQYACVDAFLSYQIGKFLNSSESTMSDRLSSLERILNKSTPDKFDLLKAHLCDSWITTADILRDVVDLIFEKAITEPPFGAMYAQLCYDVNENLPSFPYDEPGGKKISFEYVFVSNCQRVFETSDELWKEVKQMTDLEQDAERRVKQSF